MERTSPLMDVLLPRTKQHLLSAILLQPERSWYLSDLARHLRVQRSSLQRELAQFAGAGIVSKRRDGNRVYYQADRTCPVFPELSRMLAKTTGLADIVRGILMQLEPKIELAFIYGSIATSEDRSSSDVDLMVVGKATLADLAVPLRTLEVQLGRPVNPAVYTSREFVKRIAERNHFLNSVLGTKPIFIIGTGDDLARLIERAKNTASSDEFARDSRSPRRGRSRPHRLEN